MNLVFDIDGTLADHRHRLHHIALRLNSRVGTCDGQYGRVVKVELKAQPEYTVLRDDETIDVYETDDLALIRDWDSYRAGAIHDRPILPMFRLLNAHMFMKASILLVTGRLESELPITCTWLSKYAWSGLEVRPEMIVARNDKDRRSGVLYKEGAADDLRDKGFVPDVVFDDDPLVVAMWRRRGVVALDIGRERAND